MPDQHIQELVNGSGLPKGADVTVTYEVGKHWLVRVLVPLGGPFRGLRVVERRASTLPEALSRCVEDIVEHRRRRG